MSNEMLWTIGARKVCPIFNDAKRGCSQLTRKTMFGKILYAAAIFKGFQEIKNLIGRLITFENFSKLLNKTLKIKKTVWVIIRSVLSLIKLSVVAYCRNNKK